jgi:hypothetical protein
MLPVARLFACQFTGDVKENRNFMVPLSMLLLSIINTFMEYCSDNLNNLIKK